MSKLLKFWEYRITGNIKAHARRGVGPATDYATPWGTPIHSPIRGKLTFGRNDERGLWVNITNKKWRVELSHLSKVIAGAQGKTVAWRSIIGDSGNSGNVSPRPSRQQPYAGSHVHAVVYRLDKNGRAVERMSFLGWQLRHAYKGRVDKLPGEARKFLGV